MLILISPTLCVHSLDFAHIVWPSLSLWMCLSWVISCFCHQILVYLVILYFCHQISLYLVTPYFCHQISLYHVIDAIFFDLNAIYKRITKFQDYVWKCFLYFVFLHVTFLTLSHSRKPLYCVLSPLLDIFAIATICNVLCLFGCLVVHPDAPSFEFYFSSSPLYISIPCLYLYIYATHLVLCVILSLIFMFYYFSSFQIL